jgi:hypothetical protein
MAEQSQQTRCITPAPNGQRQEPLACREGRWDPFALFDELQEEMARLWGRPFGAFQVR